MYSKKRSRIEQVQIVVAVSLVLLILGFGNVIAFLDYLGQTKGFEFLAGFPSDWRNLLVLMALVYLLFEHKKVAERIAGVFK